MKILGLHYDRPFIRWAALDLKRKKFELQSLKSLSPNSIEDVKQLYMVEQKDLVATGIQSLVRQLQFKVLSSEKVQEGLPFQIESLTSLKLEDLVYTSHTTTKESNSEVTVFFSSKETLISHLAEWKNYSICPDVVTAMPQALLKFAQFRCPEFKAGIVVHLASQETVCICFENGSVRKSFVIEEGVESLLSSLWEDRKKVLFQNEVKGVAKQIDLLQLKPHLNPQLSLKLEGLRSQLSGVFHSFQQVLASPSVLFTGRTDAFVHLREYLLQESPEVIMYAPPLPLNIDEQKGALAIGFAIEAAESDQKKIQYLKGEFIPARQWKRAGKYGIALLALSVLFSSLLGIYGNSQLQLRKGAITRSLSHMVGQIDKQLESTLLNHGLEIGMTQGLRAIQKYDKEAPFLLQAPTVSEVLSWLSNNTLAQNLTKTGDPIDLIDFNYQLVSFPKIGHMREPYLAKVGIQFKLKHSMSARTFHEALLRGDDLVDETQEITWDSLNDGYHATFYLKNRAPYVH